MLVRAALLLALVCPAPLAAHAQPAPAPDPVALLLARLEETAATGDREAILAFAQAGTTVPGLVVFAGAATPAPARFIIKERDRSVLTDESVRLLLEVFAQHGTEAQISTWQMEAAREPGPGRWAVTRLERVSYISGLYRLALDPDRQLAVRNLTVTGPDVSLEIPSGSAFVAEIPDGVTGVVLLGRGRMRFTPPAEAEQTQLRIFNDEPVLDTEFDAAFIRVRPEDFEARFSRQALTPRGVSRRDFRRAERIFEEYVGRTLHLDLTDLSRERWSLLPQPGDLIAEVRTRRLGTLTYARSSKDAEDISLFDRRRRKNISVYASAEKLAARGPTYSEDAAVDYDILHQEIEAAFQPERLWVDGRTALLVRVRSAAITTLTLRLSESLTVRSVVAPELGRLLHLRVVGQNSVIVNLPGTFTRDTEFWLQVTYSGRIEPQLLEREAIVVAGEPQEFEQIQIRLEPQYVYSNRSYWYPQSPVTDYATANLRIIVPPDYDVVASGIPYSWAPAPGPVPSGERALKMFVFEADQPARYFGCLISRFSTVATAQVNVPTLPAAAGNGDGGDPLTLIVQANPRQTGKARSLGEQAAQVLEFYASIVGDAPYPSFTLAVAEGELPGGHSPAYFAVLNQTLPMGNLVWRNDPVSFDNYPAFFLAHELAHQWWGQAVGWKNYHEQWISEGFAQYFAALYAERERGRDLLTDLMRQMRKWGIDQSSQGPIHLGYRLGHIKSDGRVFRALVYNKAAVVLHMLRRLVGDDTFFSGLRRFYAHWRFRKAGTEDFRAAMEGAGAPDLTAFFDAWIYGTIIPELRFSYEAAESSVLVRFEHRGEVVPVPITVTIDYRDGGSEEVIVPVLERVVERTLPLKGAVRRIEANADHAALADIAR